MTTADWSMSNTGEFVAGEEMLKNRIVKFKSGSITTPREVEYCDAASKDWVGATITNAKVGERVDVVFRNAPGQFVGTVYGTDIGHSVEVYTMNDGMVGNSPTSAHVGSCVTDVDVPSLTGDLISVLPK